MKRHQAPYSLPPPIPPGAPQGTCGAWRNPVCRAGVRLDGVPAPAAAPAAGSEPGRRGGAAGGHTVGGVVASHIHVRLAPAPGMAAHLRHERYPGELGRRPRPPFLGGCRQAERRRHRCDGHPSGGRAPGGRDTLQAAAV
eukprot:352193-Chlamydomonas_euryale.AAC.30